MRPRMAALSLVLFAALIAAPPATAGPALLIEPATGLVLYAEDADLPWHPASLTKLMTAYLTYSALRDGKLSPEDTVTCSQLALEQPPSKVGLPLGGQMKVELALKALIVKSANDVAIMLAEKIGGSEAAFVDMMNAAAKRLGMTNTSFVNANGLPMRNAAGVEEGPQNVTSARDMALLASMLLREFPQSAELFATPEIKIGKRVLHSFNSLLRTYPGADGMKTGFICASGYNIVASATRDGRKLVAVVLGENSGSARALRAEELFDHGFAIYPWKAVLAPTLATLPAATPPGAVPADLHNIVCRGGLARRGRRPALKPGHRKPGLARPRSHKRPAKSKAGSVPTASPAA